MKPSGKVHTCAVCGKRDVWGNGWQAYYSLRDVDDGETELIAANTVCSDACRERHVPVKPKAIREAKKPNRVRQHASGRTPAPRYTPERSALSAPRVGWCGPI